MCFSSRARSKGKESMTSILALILKTGFSCAKKGGKRTKRSILLQSSNRKRWWGNAFCKSPSKLTQCANSY